jgi:4-hydroxybenzoate polyprenyltransferase
VSAAEAPVVHLSPRRGPVRALLVSLRPRQWTKSLLIFAGIVFAAKIGDPVRWLQALAAFAAWCAASSAAYLVNDVLDVAEDRRHPIKRRRPVARGELSQRRALAVAVVLAVAAGLVAGALGPGTLACLAGFLALQLVYTTALKRIVLVDVIAIAGLFVIRAAAGAIAVDVRISPWLLVCTGLLALFLALGKRRSELAAVAERPVGGTTRRALAGYDVALLDQLLGIVAGTTIVTYALYTMLARESWALVVTIPFVVFGVFRYLLLLRRTTRGEEPETVLLRDPWILATVAGWVAVCAVILVTVVSP